MLTGRCHRLSYSLGGFRSGWLPLSIDAGDQFLKNRFHFVVAQFGDGMNFPDGKIVSSGDLLFSVPHGTLFALVH
ncbi:hypothetical protein [Paracoccus broussonetiae]|uniref:hypothetical protein n=1 Tax=Paracoccus broussonetiae TaxID=3075834 RepID=UPI00288BFBA9|nr:hypothetical protein [Paracoccus sp. CPCC 101403]